MKSTPSGELVAVRPGDLESGYPGDSDPNSADPNDPDLDLGVLLLRDSVPDPGILSSGDKGVKFPETLIFLS